MNQFKTMIHLHNHISKCSLLAKDIHGNIVYYYILLYRYIIELIFVIKFEILKCTKYKYLNIKLNKMNTAKSAHILIICH